ncbi:putative nuclease HARBI1 [Penaeus vannamei]|uniref:putative nuclease HARBI1 n=1 Tax=Penaeus vannamei TaxID=6689 RepID=UPI00387F897B
MASTRICRASLLELRLEDHQGYHDFTRMTRNCFCELLLVMPLICKSDTNMRKAVTPEERLAVTLRYLAQALYQVLEPIYLKIPSTSEEWQKVAHKFFTRWNFPNCLGAIDGKRVLIAKPAKSGSEYYDYKGQNSMIMLAMVDADYRFIFIHAGSFGRASDAGVWDKRPLREAMDTGFLNVPRPAPLPFTNIRCPYMIVGDDAFPLKLYLMKPYPGKDLSVEQGVFNYRLCARRVSENAFGILSAKFRGFKQPICTTPKNVEDVILCTVALHIFYVQNRVGLRNNLLGRILKKKNSILPGQWQSLPHGALEQLQVFGRGHSSGAQAVREKLKILQ